MARAEAVFAQCGSQPGVLAFALDHWAALLEAQHRRQAAGAAEGGALQPHLPETMLAWLWDKVNDLVLDEFTEPPPPAAHAASQLLSGAAPRVSVPLDDARLGAAELWFNLDGALAPAYVRIAPLAASKDASKR